MNNLIAHYHLPGLFEFYEFYKRFLKLFYEHREYFYEWCDIASIYGAPADCLWGGGRVGFGDDNPHDVLSLMNKYNISSRLTFSNSLIEDKHLNDYKCNKLCEMFNSSNIENGIIIYSDLLLDYINHRYPNLYFVSSTTKVLTNFIDLKNELKRNEFKYVVPDFRLNKQFEKLNNLSIQEKNKIELLVNECCDINCMNRKTCYENVSRKSLGIDDIDFKCTSPNASDGYRFSSSMKNPCFISIDDIKNIYLPMGIYNFKIEGRSLGSALILEFLLYYMVKVEYQLIVREEIYLNNNLDLF